jgi:glucuronate isomerase
MTTVAILPSTDANGQKIYRAIAGEKQSVGKTAGQALDALTIQLQLENEESSSTMLIIQSFRPDPFLSAQQQQKLAELMSLWQTAQSQGQELPQSQQAELDNLVEAELKAATARSAALAQQIN